MKRLKSKYKWDLFAPRVNSNNISTSALYVHLIAYSWNVRQFPKTIHANSSVALLPLLPHFYIAYAISLHKLSTANYI